jgi:hypothetical protein
MKRRHRQLLNLLSLGLLLFALYLNFIKKESDEVTTTVTKGSSLGATLEVKEGTATAGLK